MDSLRASLSLAPGQRVADLGCGRGELGRLLLPAVTPGTVDGFDADPDQIAAAQRDPLPRLRFEEADARRVDRDDATYDRVVCQALLVHQSHPEDVVGEMARLVRPGGLVGVIEPPATPLLLREPGDDVADVRERWRRACQSAKRGGLGTWDAADHLADWLDAAGLVEIQASASSATLSLAPPYSAADEALRDELLAWEESAEAEAETLTWLAGEDGADPTWLAAVSAAESTARADRLRALRRARWSGSLTVEVAVVVGRRSL